MESADTQIRLQQIAQSLYTHCTHYAVAHAARELCEIVLEQHYRIKALEEELAALRSIIVTGGPTYGGSFG